MPIINEELEKDPFRISDNHTQTRPKVVKFPHETFYKDIWLSNELF